MAVSVYFNNQGATREQILIEDMIIESIRNHGIDVYYLPRESHSELDRLFGDDPVKKYTKAFKIDMYLESFQDFEGNQEFFSKFGLQIQKEARVAVARRTFERYFTTIFRKVPKEGDLIFMPVQQKLLEIRFVEEEKNFFQAGKFAPYMYGLNLEVFKYNGEIIDTGVAELDAIADLSAYGIEFTLNAGGSGTYDDHEIVYQGATLAAATAKGYVSSWDLPNRKLIIRNIKGSFAANTVIKGSESSAQWTVTSSDPQDNATDDFEENVLLENEADNILDWTETNPFGTSDEN
jgi:RNase P protein component